MYLFYFTIITGLLYIYTSLISRKSPTIEAFSHKSSNSYDKDDMFDSTYVFIADQLFFDKEYYNNFCKVIIKYLNSVYNNHLSIGIKHGGHINELLKNNTNKTTSITDSNVLTHFCNYNYPSNTYKFVSNYDEDSYIFQENTFTHISIIDKEIYSNKNINGLLYNCYKWLTHKGYLFIEVFDNVHDLKKQMSNGNANSKFIRVKYNYTNNIQELNNSRFHFKEQFKLSNNKIKKNIHEIVYNDIEYIKNIANKIGFVYTTYIQNISNGRSVLIFQKS
uniref:Methyltransferase n=1 Tax=Florenciella sp. virus SA2 TaxID=3240092 RepID=A0AB39JED5_9VIRU